MVYRVMRGRFLLASAMLALVFLPRGFAQGRTVAITVDDLPYASGPLAPPGAPEPVFMAATVNARLLAAFRFHHVPVTGFVIQKRVESEESGTRILKEWLSRGFDLGNHTYSHTDINDLALDRIEQEIPTTCSTMPA
jgi:peptidoglycan/xylan/chitin deacetylase (PgdA/CDA1 family)